MVKKINNQTSNQNNNSKKANRDIFFSIVVPCYNCEKTLQQCISSIINQDYINFELLLVEDMSADSTKKIILDAAKSSKKVKPVFLKEKGFAGGARNTGKKLASGDVVVFLDSDVTIGKDYLSVLAKTYSQHPEAVGVGGSVVNPYKSYLSQAVHLLTMSNQLPTGKIRRVRTNPTINSSYKKDFIKGLFFLQHNTAAEDALFDYKVAMKGGTILFNPSLKVYHFHPRLDLNSFIDRQKFYGRGFVMSRRLYPLPGRILLEKKCLLLLLPRLILVLKRVLFTRYIFSFILTLPLLIYVEILRTIEIFKEDKSFMKQLGEKRKDFELPSDSKLKYEMKS